VGDYITLSKKILKSLITQDMTKKDKLYNSLNRFSIKNNITSYKKLFKKI